MLVPKGHQAEMQPLVWMGGRSAPKQTNELEKAKWEGVDHCCVGIDGVMNAKAVAQTLCWCSGFPLLWQKFFPIPYPQMSPFPFSPPDSVVSVAAPPAVEDSVEALDARRPIIRPIPHVAILQDELTQLFSDDYEEEEEMEARGEHTLSETFGGHFVAAVICLEVSTFNHGCWVCAWWMRQQPQAVTLGLLGAVLGRASHHVVSLQFVWRTPLALTAA